MKPVDAHCHLDFENFDEDREEIIEECKEKLEFVVNAGSNVEHNKSALRLQEKHSELVKANLGLHPTYVDDFDQLEEVKKQIRENDPVAVGEIGMDYHHVTDEEKREKQEEVFRELLELAEELEKPVVVHSRDAEKQAVSILENYDLTDVMLHCFNGTPELAERAVENGMTVGISTQVLYSIRVQNLVGKLSTGDILLETDSPFLYRGDRNKPTNVLESLEKIAEIKSVEKEEIIKSTTENAKRIFSGRKQ